MWNFLLSHPALIQKLFTKPSSLGLAQVSVDSENNFSFYASRVQFNNFSELKLHASI